MNGNYDNAQICLNGHVITSAINENQANLKKHCEKCGEITITNCLNCNKQIRGSYISDSIFFPYYDKPNFCKDCGKPYPWTQRAIDATLELAGEIDNITNEEQIEFKDTIENLVKDTPKTSVAIVRYKKIALKAGKVIADGFKSILIDIASESVKKTLFPS